VYRIIFIAEKVPLKQTELFVRSMVSILYLKIRANFDFKSFEVEILT